MRSIRLASWLWALLYAGFLFLPSLAAQAAPLTPVRIEAQTSQGILELTITWAQATTPTFQEEYHPGAARITLKGATLKGGTQLIPLSGTNVREALISQVDADTVVINLRAQVDPKLKSFALKPVKEVQGRKYVLSLNLPAPKAAEPKEEQPPEAKATQPQKEEPAKIKAPAPKVKKEAKEAKPPAPKAKAEPKETKAPAPKAKEEPKKESVAKKDAPKAAAPAPQATPKATQPKKEEPQKPAPPQLTPQDPPVKVKVIFNPKTDELRVGFVYKGNLRHVVRKAQGSNSKMSIELCPAVLVGPDQKKIFNKGQITQASASQVGDNKVLVEIGVLNPPYFIQDVDPQGGALYGISYNYSQDARPTTSTVKRPAAPKAKPAPKAEATPKAEAAPKGRV